MKKLMKVGRQKEELSKNMYLEIYNSDILKELNYLSTGKNILITGEPHGIYLGKFLARDVHVLKKSQRFILDEFGHCSYDESKIDASKLTKDEIGYFDLMRGYLNIQCSDLLTFGDLWKEDSYVDLGILLKVSQEARFKLGVIDYLPELIVGDESIYETLLSKFDRDIFHNKVVSFLNKNPSKDNLVSRVNSFT